MKQNIIILALATFLFLEFQAIKKVDILNKTGWTKKEVTILYKVADSLNIKTATLIKIIELESNFDTKAENPKTRAIGLIQWLPSTLTDFNLTTSDVWQMSVTEQLYLINKYYSRYNITKPIQAFAVTFYPEMINHWQDSLYVIGSEVSIWRAKEIALKNAGYDTDNNGTIELKEYKNYIENILK